MAACVFCSIVAGALPAHRVLEDDAFVAFLDARPVFPGHTLVVPRIHRGALADLAQGELGPLLGHGQRIAAAFGPALGADGTFVALNDRVSQSVPHLHLHVVPRRKGDGLRGFFWPRHKYASPEEAEGLARRIRAALAEAGPGGT
jgi:histidine triad (HIT) family protein